MINSNDLNELFEDIIGQTSAISLLKAAIKKSTDMQSELAGLAQKHRK